MTAPPPTSALPPAAALARRVAAHQPVTSATAWAATALVLTDAAHGPEILFIKRVVRRGDRWSGDMALPGGKHDPRVDATVADTAMRETAEEVGIRLAPPVARLDDIVGRPSTNRVATLVFTVDGRPEPVPEPGEVETAVWLPVGALLEEGSRTWFRYAGVVPFPALEVHGYTIWGLTHRMVTHFLAVAGLS